MDTDELDRVLREFRKDHPSRQPKHRKRSQHKTGMDQLVDCIERQLNVLENANSTTPPAG